MAIVHFVKHKRTQTVGGLNAVINYCCKDAKVDYQGRPLISGINCVPQCALQEFMNTKRLHHSTNGRLYYHMVQSFRPDDSKSAFSEAKSASLPTVLKYGGTYEKQ